MSDITYIPPIDAYEILRLEGFTISCVILLKYPSLPSLLAARDTPAPVLQEMPNAGWNSFFGFCSSGRLHDAKLSIEIKYVLRLT
jgi:hypothetical protein